MSINLDLPKAATAAVDEAAKDAPLLGPVLKNFADYLVAQLKSALIGRTITITIK